MLLAFCITICHTSLGPNVIPRIIHNSKRPRVPRNTTLEPAAFEMTSRGRRPRKRFAMILNCVGHTGAVCRNNGPEESVSYPPTLIGVNSPLGVTCLFNPNGPSCVAAVTSICECKGGDHLARFNFWDNIMRCPILSGYRDD